MIKQAKIENQIDLVQNDKCKSRFDDAVDVFKYYLFYIIHRMVSVAWLLNRRNNHIPQRYEQKNFFPVLPK